MNQTQDTTLLEVLVVIPDPRKARGRRYAWPLLLTLVATGLASGQQTMHAIAQWIPLHADCLRAALPTLTTLPSESTLLRVTRQIDVSILESADEGTWAHRATNIGQDHKRSCRPGLVWCRPTPAAYQ